MDKVNAKPWKKKSKEKSEDDVTVTQNKSLREVQLMIDRGIPWMDSWLRPFEEGAPVPSEGFIGIRRGRETRSIPRSSMMDIYERASFRAVRENSLDWAGIAVRAANLWAQAEDSWNRKNALLRAMRLRAGFISKLDASPGHPVLDGEAILLWFTEELTLSVDDAKAKAARWKDTSLPSKSRLTLDELQDLRDLKTRIGIVKILADSGKLPKELPANEWLKIRRELP